MLTNRDPIELTALRRDLHRHLEISGEEAQTAATIVWALTPMNPTGVITGMGGHGVDRPTVLFRAELDALPIPKISQNDWVSQVAGRRQGAFVRP